MKKHFDKIFLIIFLIILSYPYRLFPKDDIEYWISQSVEKRIDAKWSVNLQLDYRFNTHDNPLYLHCADYELKHKFTSALSWSLNYRQVYQRTNRFYLEHRPHFNATMILLMDMIKLKNRFRVECRLPEAAKRVWRCRNKVGIEVNKGILKLPCIPYFEDEIFWDLQSEKINKNWLFAGFKISVMRHCQCDLFIMLQLIKRTARWERDVIFGTYFHYTI